MCKIQLTFFELHSQRNNCFPCVKLMWHRISPKMCTLLMSDSFHFDQITYQMIFEQLYFLCFTVKTQPVFQRFASQQKFLSPILCISLFVTFVLRDFLHQLVVLGLLPLQVVFDHGLPDDNRSLVLTRHLDQETNIPSTLGLAQFTCFLCCFVFFRHKIKNKSFLSNGMQKCYVSIQHIRFWISLLSFYLVGWVVFLKSDQ